MARLPYVDPKKAPEEVRATLEQLPVNLNIFNMIANAETCFRPFLGLGTAILGQQQLDAKLRELVILHVGNLWKGEYEWTQHVPIALAVGATDEQIAAIRKGEVAADCFDDCERAVLAFAGEVVENAKPCDATFEAAAKHLSPREIVELTLAIGFYTTVAMLTETTEIEIDDPAGTAVLDASR